MINCINTIKNDFNKDLVKAVIQLGLTADQLGELTNHYLSIAVNGDCCAELSGAMSKCVVELSLLKGDTVRSTVFNLMNDDDAKLPYAELQCVVGAVNYLLANFRDISNVKRLVVGDKDLSKLYRVARTALGLRQCDLAKLLSNTVNVPYEVSTLTTFIGRIENSTRLSYVSVNVVKMLVDALNNLLSDVKLINLKPDSDEKEKSAASSNSDTSKTTIDYLDKVKMSSDVITKLILFYYHFANEDRLQFDMRVFVKDKTSAIMINEPIIKDSLTSMRRGFMTDRTMLEFINGVARHLVTQQNKIRSFNNPSSLRLNHTDPFFIDNVNAIASILCLRKADLIHLIQHHVDISVSSSVINKALTALNQDADTARVTDSVKSMLASGVNSFLEEWGFIDKIPQQKSSKLSLTLLNPTMYGLDKHLQNALTALDLTPSQLTMLIKDDRLKLVEVDALNRYIGNLLLDLSVTSPSMSIVVDAVCSVVNKLLVNAGYVKLDIPTNQNRLDRVLKRSRPATRDKRIDVERKEVTRVRDAVYGFSVSDVHGDVKINPPTSKSDGEIENSTEQDSVLSILTNLVNCNNKLVEQNQHLTKEIKRLSEDVQNLTQFAIKQDVIRIAPQQPAFNGYCSPYHRSAERIAVEWQPGINVVSQYGCQVITNQHDLLSIANQSVGLTIHVNRNHMASLQYTLGNMPSHISARCTVFVRT